jgi:mono/diheme cytochrome c family protein
MASSISRTGRILVLVGIAALMVASALVLAAQEGARNLDPNLVAKTDSPSGLKWIGGNRSSPFMHPGMSCIGCHQAIGGEAPAYIVAGTVYTKLDEPDDVLGVEGATVQVTDSKGQVVKLDTNKAGNYFLRSRGASLAAPLSVKVIFKGKERKMLTSPPSGNCLLCHTAKGAAGAPGRVIAP